MVAESLMAWCVHFYFVMLLPLKKIIVPAFGFLLEQGSTLSAA
jgi:hypothetical protein